MREKKKLGGSLFPRNSSSQLVHILHKVYNTATFACVIRLHSRRSHFGTGICHSLKRQLDLYGFVYCINYKHVVYKIVIFFISLLQGLMLYICVTFTIV